MVAVTGHSEMLSQKHTYKGMQLCKGTEDALDAVVPLEATPLFVSNVRLGYCCFWKRKGTGRFLLHNRQKSQARELAKVRRVQNPRQARYLNSRNLQWLGIHWREDSPPSGLWSKGWWAERLRWSGRWCSLVTAATTLWSTVSRVDRRQEENVSAGIVQSWLKQALVTPILTILMTRWTRSCRHCLVRVVGWGQWCKFSLVTEKWAYGSALLSQVQTGQLRSIEL